MAVGHRYRLRLYGTLELRAPCGAEVTPRLRKARALLAYLALAEGRRVERRVLERLLWPDRMPPQARDSLKKALTHLRRSFEEAAAQPVETDGGPVRLSLADIDVDALDPAIPAAAPLLEGIGIDDPGFRSWLAAERARRARPEIAPPPPEIDRQRRFCIAMPPIRTSHPGGAGYEACAILRDCLARALEQTDLVQVIETGAEPQRAGAAPPADLHLTAMAFEGRDSVMVSLATTRVGTGERLWSASEVLDLPMAEPAAIYRTATAFAEQICDSLWQNAGSFGPAHAAAAAAINAIQHIARLSAPDIAKAQAALSQATEHLDRSPLYGWLAYLTAFQLEKRGPREADDIRERARYFSARALELDRANPLTRALCAHAHSFVLRDLDTAREIVSPVRGMVSQNVMLADTVGLLHFYGGRYDESLRHAMIACDLGRWNPLEYAFTTSLASSRLMLGDVSGALRASRRAMAQHPTGLDFRFEPTLRTFAASCALSGTAAEEGRAAMALLNRQLKRAGVDPTDAVPEAVFPNPEVYSMIRQGLERLYD